MSTKQNIVAAALMALGSLTMCSSVQTNEDGPKRAASEVGPLKSGSVAEELSALGIEVETEDVQSDWDSILSVEQVTADASTGDYAFKRVEGVHPCQRDEVLTDDCREISERLAKQLADDDKPRSASALSELQALTPDVIDPQSFDPAITAGELGRSPLPQSQAAQALGFQLLQPPPQPVEPEPEDAPVDDIDGTLPDIPLDILINQLPGNGG